MKKSEVFRGLSGKNAPDCFGSLRTPCYVIDEERLKENGRILALVAERTGCRILLAQKAFSNYDFYPLLAPYLAGTEASGLYEARLGAEEMPGKEVHVFCAAYREDEFEELLRYADHIVFNSVNQLKRFGKEAKAKGKSIGLRINPECSTQEGHEIYDPCAKGSRLGVTREAWNREMTEDLLEMLDGLEEAIDGGYFDREDLEAPRMVKKALLNGASDWDNYSWGGCALIYNWEIAERLCTPYELKKTRGGERRPNSREEWLDVQARALYQASRMIYRAIERASREG